ncbi:hypothetical protein GGI25_001485 [Coemansia spiralis]|uniref:Uncharacterized protein n=2 Tax=Coemansia TaxID=4863 RepID=A0A9W8GCQ6_9FUNG|nr:hypothetical protein BX070DRAFT_232078 [Coemansia spiralis]KAJ1994825.1 hypothetical protein EDC05_001448 [Coemansia umbellata]KAJ2624473.1 hypothetical protein GGI26_001391 [Coemansia sp. RSA 1358]KAJ2679562.1 hypothetical protein GGI25_001485 [Coemansia spiralis]
MTNTFTYVKESYVFNKRTFIYPGQLESSAQAAELEPVWTVQVHDREASICNNRRGPIIMTAVMEGARKDLAQFSYHGKMTNGGFDGTRSTWAFIDFDGKRYDWVASMMQDCWKLEDSDGKMVAQYIGMSRDMKVKGTVAFHTKVSESLIALIHLSARLLKYSDSVSH